MKEQDSPQLRDMGVRQDSSPNAFDMQYDHREDQDAMDGDEDDEAQEIA